MTKCDRLFVRFPLKQTKYVIFSFLRFGCELMSVSSATQRVMPQKYAGKWGMECFNTSLCLQSCWKNLNISMHTKKLFTNCDYVSCHIWKNGKSINIAPSEWYTFIKNALYLDRDFYNIQFYFVLGLRYRIRNSFVNRQNICLSSA